MPTTPAHYLITVGGKRFFVGYAPSLRGCPLFEPDRLGLALETIYDSSASERDIKIKTRKFDLAKINKREGGGARAKWQAAQREKLVAYYEPAANVLSPHKRAANILSPRTAA